MFGGLHSPRPLPAPGALLALGRVFTPRVEALGETPVLLDLSGLGRTFAAPESLGRALMSAARERQIEANVALAFTRTATLVLARAREGLVIVPAGGEAAALRSLPLHALDIAKEHLELFQRWGLRSIGDLQALPPKGLAERLGPDGPRLVRLARGEDTRPLVPAPLEESFAARLDLDWAVDGLEPLSFLLAQVLETLCAALHARGRKAVAVTLELTLASGRPDRRTLRPAAPSGEARTWRTLLLLDLETRLPGDAVTALVVSAEPTPAREVQFSLLDPAQPSPEKLAETLARLQSFTAAGRGGAASLPDTHRPGAFVMGTFGPGGGGAGPESPPWDIRVLGMSIGSPTCTGLECPTPRAALRVFRPPLRAEVLQKNGEPVFVAAPGVRGAVDDRAGPWRASGDWWAEAFAREEWDVLVAGRLLRLVHDRLREEWLVEGELD